MCVSSQIFVIVVWNFEIYMIPLALLLPLAWNYVLIASGKDTRQDDVSSLNSLFILLFWTVKAHFQNNGRSKINQSYPIWTLHFELALIKNAYILLDFKQISSLEEIFRSS